MRPVSDDEVIASMEKRLSTKPPIDKVAAVFWITYLIVMVSFLVVTARFVLKLL